jgi:hypothetical protein
MKFNFLLTKKNNLKHEDYDEDELLNDIAMLRLSEKVELTEYIQISCLPKEESNHYPGWNIEAWIVGWGTFDILVYLIKEKAL